MILYYLLQAHYLSSTGSLSIPMILYYLLLYWLTAYPYGTLLPSTAPCLSLWYSITFYWVPTYYHGTLLPSIDLLNIPMVLYYLLLVIAYTKELYYLLLAPGLSICFSSILYWLPAYTYDTLLSSTRSLSIPMILFHLLLTPCQFYGTLLPSTGFLHIPMVLFYLLLSYCLSPWNCTIFY